MSYVSEMLSDSLWWWFQEYQDGNKNITIDDTNMKQTVYVFKCLNSTIQINGKVNSIILDNCKKCAVVFDDVIAAVDFVNCQSVQGQVSIVLYLLMQYHLALLNAVSSSTS